eukprot:74487_1
MKQSIRLQLVALFSIIITSLYLIGTRNSSAYNAIHDGKTLSYWYWIGANIRSLFGFAVNVLWPYVICNWISLRCGIILTMYCYGFDSVFRLFWFYCKTYFYHNASSKDIFLLFWAAVNDINTFFIVPIIVYLIHGQYSKHPPENIIKKKMHSISKPHKLSINSDSTNLLEPLLAEADYLNEYSKNKHFNKIIAFYIITGLWFTGQDMYQYYDSNLKYSHLIRLPPIVCATGTFMWELYVCKKHKQVRFVHYALMCLFIPVQQLYFDWTYFVVQINDWSVFTQLDQNMANLFVFVLYTIYFQFISFVGFKLSEHISILVPNVFELNFIFVFYSEMFLTIYLSSITKIDWTVLLMIAFKIFIKTIKFHRGVIKYVPFATLNGKKLAKRYVYSILSTIYVFVCRNALLMLDYSLSGDRWILPIPKTMNNLLTSTFILFITFIGQSVGYWVISNVDKTTYCMDSLKRVPINGPYFCMVIIISQIFSIFLPWFYLFKQ